MNQKLSHLLRRIFNRGWRRRDPARWGSLVPSSESPDPCQGRGQARSEVTEHQGQKLEQLFRIISGAKKIIISTSPMTESAGQTQTSTLSRQWRYFTFTLLSHIPEVIFWVEQYDVNIYLHIGHKERDIGSRLGARTPDWKPRRWRILLKHSGSV